MKTLFLDIETVPTEHGFKHGKPRGPEESEEQYLKRLSLSALTARVLCLGYASEPPVDAPVAVLSGDEADILQKFWAIATQADLFVGHNVLDFDLRFIVQRSILQRVKPARDIPFARYRNAPVFDTMHEWTKWGREGVRLDALAQALELPSPKEGMDGSKVYEAFVAGRMNEIYEYCRGDVDTVRRVYRRLKFLEGA
jgi:predicted PolB exonuclease-like 3'-5' exonuclease